MSKTRYFFPQTPHCIRLNRRHSVVLLSTLPNPSPLLRQRPMDVNQGTCEYVDDQMRFYSISRPC